MSDSSKPSEVVISLSGGLDSVVLAYYLKSKGYQVVTAFLNFGTNSSSRELDTARFFALQLRIPLEIIDFTGLGSIVRSHGFIGQLDGGDIQDPDPEFGSDADNLIGGSDDIFVPTAFYNTLAPITYLSRVLHINRIALGIIKENISARPGTLNFFKSWESAIPQFDMQTGSTPTPFDVMLPFHDKSKAEVIKIGLDLGVPLDTTYSCYKGRALHCKTCSACKERVKGFSEAGISDPTWYEKSPYVAGTQTRQH